MQQHHAICLVVDGLRASALGTYGNTIFPTPQLDRLASRSLVIDWLWADSSELPHFYRSAWQGQHALRPACDEATQMPHVLQAAGVRQSFVTDDPWLARQSRNLPFDQVWTRPPGAARAAEAMEETALAGLLIDTVERLEAWLTAAGSQPTMTWLHVQGLRGPWDAPQASRTALFAAEDLPPLDVIATPQLVEGLDEDQLQAYRVAYAAQVAVLDSCWGAFYDALVDSFLPSNTLLMLLGSRGFALGEHGALGCDVAQAYSERLHVPWLVHRLGHQQPVQRESALAQPADVGATLLDWFGQKFAPPGDGQSVLPMLDGQPGLERELAVTHGPQQAIRTPAWLLRQAAGAELYAKPDDRWEANDVASCCPQVVEGLQAELQRFTAAAQSADPLPCRPVDHEFVKTSR